MADTNSGALVEAESLSVHFPRHRSATRPGIAAVDRIDLKIHRGEILGLVGESGCGKSTLARTLLGLIEPSGGVVRFGGDSIGNLPERQMRPYRRRMQIVFQDPYSSLNPRMRIGETIAEAMFIHGHATKSDAAPLVADLLKLVGLDPAMAGRFPHEFSGGQRQRIGIARALAVRPEFIACDEPVSALDVSIQAQIVNLLHDLREKMGLTFLFVSHDLAVVRHISDRVAIMYLGRIVEIAPKERVYDEPLHPYTQALLLAVPVPTRTSQKRSARKVMQGEVPSPLNPPSGCHFHPRCPHAFAPCALKQPPLREVATGHFVACHLYEPQQRSAEPDHAEDSARREGQTPHGGGSQVMSTNPGQMIERSGEYR
ncbi:ABC transporter ATP-binding protein [Bradyrhizobium sp. NAS80.1]|uniref:ABC transporter ATP-binding protein n=1 Tax=Bradyrhizobium sp. NAS80.1 TaxID=1680159 RepID=UPI000A027FA7|nr:ABC transporter ATP-binding protein [Bradyrhizobium sp. NAS80.1]